MLGIAGSISSDVSGIRSENKCLICPVLLLGPIFIFHTFIERHLFRNLPLTKSLIGFFYHVPPVPPTTKRSEVANGQSFFSGRECSLFPPIFFVGIVI